MNNVVALHVPRRMSAAEFKVRRERLGLTSAWVAAQLGVSERSVSRYETGRMPVSHEAEELIEAVHAYTNRQVMRAVAELKVPKGADSVTLFTFARDIDMHDGAYVETGDQEYGPLSASWHRAMIGRIALLTDLPTRIEYIGD